MSDREIELDHRAAERIADRFVLGTNLAANTWTAFDERRERIVIVRFEATHAQAQQRFAALLERWRVAPAAVPEPLLASAPQEPPFVAREYLLGTTLEAQLSESLAQKRAGLGGLAFELLARGLTTALAALHRGRFAHGALAPSRVVTLETRARLLGTESRQPPLARTERLEYASARVVAGEPATPADDLWSLGLLTFRALTGQSYWPASTARELREAIANDPVISPTERARERNLFAPLPRGYDDWFRACVTRDASIAYTDGADALDGLEVLVLRGERADDTGRPSVCLEIAPPERWDPEVYALIANANTKTNTNTNKPIAKPSAPAPAPREPLAMPCLSPVRPTAMPCLSVAPPLPKEQRAIEPVAPGEGTGGPYRSNAWRAPAAPRRSRVGCAVLLGVAVTGAVLAYWLARPQ